MLDIRRFRRISFTSSVLLALALAGCSAGSSPAPADANASPKNAPIIQASPAFHSAETGTIADVVEGVLPSVVSVTSTKKARSRARSPMDLFFGAPQRGQPQQGLGSGVILTADGIVITNNHVIDGADVVQVQIHDGREFEAKVVGADPKSDVAVLQLEGELGPLTPARVGDSASLRLGDVVLAVGNPFGVGQTVTMGIVSATGRSDMGIVDYENFIQTDAAINPGNSGGALVNMRGELVGINTAILSRSGGSMGIGFAIPTNMAAPIVEALRADGMVSRGFLGVRIQDLDSDLRAALSLKNTEGVLIADVEPNGAADRSGVKSGDVVTQVGKDKVSTTGQFRNLIAAAGADAKVKLKLIRNGKPLTVDVELDALPNEGEEAVRGPTEGEESSEIDGVTLTDLDDNLRKRLSVPPDLDGAVITRVAPGSKAAEAKLMPGDVVLQVDKKAVDSAAEAHKRFSTSKGPTLVQIFRRGARHFVVIK